MTTPTKIFRVLTFLNKSHEEFSLNQSIIEYPIISETEDNYILRDLGSPNKSKTRRLAKKAVGGLSVSTVTHVDYLGSSWV